ncbi:hypothetical protein [Solicola gregarius]|uniref:Uncharacterized protein n=1 Tax=Solicola gregarius TaxID=2908642 RepID=A0AA46TJK3_9ACTN|nr:hypothetical protein [Solicola gregarius]UYM06049.1 hypothetical protein L0C25_02965 [Solicola gregarius]
MKKTLCRGLGAAAIIVSVVALGAPSAQAADGWDSRTGWDVAGSNAKPGWDVKGWDAKGWDARGWDAPSGARLGWD